MINFKPSHMVRDYVLTFHEKGKITAVLVVAASDSLTAENIGRSMMVGDVIVTVKR